MAGPTIQTYATQREKGGPWLVVKERFHENAPTQVRYLLSSGKWSPPVAAPPATTRWFPTNEEASKALQERVERDAQEDAGAFG